MDRYDLRTNKHFTLKTNPLQYEDLQGFVKCYNLDNRFDRKETERFKAFTYSDLLERDKVNMDIFWLKDEGSITVYTIVVYGLPSLPSAFPDSSFVGSKMNVLGWSPKSKIATTQT